MNEMKKCIWSETGTNKEKGNYSFAQYFVEDDGGRVEAGFVGKTGDCATRAIAIITGMPYKDVYDLINEYGKKERITKSRKVRSSARTGVWKETLKKIMIDLGYKWTPTMLIGQGCKVHLRGDELPLGKILCVSSKHYVAVVDGIIHDTYDSSRQGTRCVYGYYKK